MKQNDYEREIGAKNYQDTINAIGYYFDEQEMVQRIFNNAEFMKYDNMEDYQDIIDMYITGLSCYVPYEEIVKNKTIASIVNGLTVGITPENKLRISGRKPMVLFNTDKMNDKDKKVFLIEELIELVKTASSPVRSEGQNIVMTNGLSDNYYSINKSGNGYTVNYMFNRGYGLESMFNAIQAEEIVNDYLYPNCEYMSNKIYKEFIKDIYYEKDLNRYIMHAEMYGKKDELVKHFDKNTFNGAYEELEQYWDNFIIRKNKVTNKEELQALYRKVALDYKTYLSPLYTMYKEGKKVNARTSRSRNS